MNSSLYDCVVMHHRLVPLKHRFVYKVFMFYLDVDELDELGRRSWLFSRNRFNLFSFRDRDHLWLDRPTVRENVVAYLKTKGVDIGSGRIMLLTNVRTLGHVFNPVSFYFCFDEAGEPVCAVPEVGNTFRELKPYLLRRDALKDGTFRERQTKHFYVSPFFDLDTVFEFQLGIPGERLQVKIDDYQQEKKAFNVKGTLLDMVVKNREPVYISDVRQNRSPLMPFKTQNTGSVFVLPLVYERDVL